MARVLVIDDNRITRETIVKALSNAGHEVYSAADGSEGWKLQATVLAELVITDLIMPEMEGNEFIIRTRKTYPSSKIIAISGGGTVSSGEYLEVAEMLGAHRTLRKPVDMEDLVAIVNALLQ